MFNNRHATLIILLSFLFSFNSKAQTSSEGKVFSGTIEKQFDVLLNNAFPYDNFKDIRNDLPNFKKNTLDSLQKLQNKIQEQQKTINNQNESIDSLKNDLKTAEVQISKGDNVSFLGIPFEKNTYQTIVWSIILILILALLFFIQRFKSNSQTAKQSKLDVALIQEEFDNHRKKAMEREQKLKRALQDELNKSNR